MNQLRKVRREKLAELQQNGRDPFQITKFNQTYHSLEVKDLYEAHEAEILKDHQQPNVEGMDEEQAKEALKNDYEERRSIMDASPIHVAIAGRMMFKRVMGKASFCNIQDLQGNIQVYVARDAIGTESYADFKKSDIGDIFGLEGLAETEAANLPYGAQRKLEIARALATGMKLLLLDEPAAGMNPTETEDLLNCINTIRDRFGIAILLIEHDMSLVMNVCQRIQVLDYGRTIASGTPEEIANNPQVISAYLGADDAENNAVETSETTERKDA